MTRLQPGNWSCMPVLLLLAVSTLVSPVYAEDSGTLRADVELNATNGGFDFDGLGPGLNLGASHILDFSGSNFTVAAWVKLASYCNDSGTDLGPPCDMSIVDKMDDVDSVNNFGWRLLKQSDGHFWFCLGAGPGNGCDESVNTTVISQTVAATAVWYHIAAVKTSGRISIYVNGTLDGTSLLGGYFDASVGPVLIGANSVEGAFLVGQIGQVQLFKCALSGPQVRALYGASKGKYAL